LKSGWNDSAFYLVFVNFLRFLLASKWPFDKLRVNSGGGCAFCSIRLLSAGDIVWMIGTVESLLSVSTFYLAFGNFRGFLLSSKWRTVCFCYFSGIYYLLARLSGL